MGSLKNKKYLSLCIAMGLGISAYADTSNPFDIFNTNTSSNNSTTNTSSSPTTASPAPSSAAPASNVTNASPSNKSTSPYVQPGALVAPATNPQPASSNTSQQNAAPSSSSQNSAPVAWPGSQNPGWAAPSNSGSSTSSASSNVQQSLQQQSAPQPLPANRYNAANAVAPTVAQPIPSPLNTPMPINPITPSGGGGGGMGPSGNIISLLTSINQGVQSVNGNLLTQTSNASAAGAANVPSTSTNLNDFIYNQSGYAFLLNLPPINTGIWSNFGAPQGSSASNNQSNSSSSSNSTTSSTSRTSSNNLSPSAWLLMPMAQTKPGSSLLSLNSPQNFLAGIAPWASLSSGAADVVTYVFNQLLAQTKPLPGMQQSEMSALQSAVNVPFSNTPDPTSGQTWFQQLATASTPQLLRTLAVLLAENNQMQYQQMQNVQTLMLEQAAQLGQPSGIQQQLALMIKTQQQTNNLLNQVLVKLSEKQNQQ